jgi:hypothetical protein
MKNKYTYFLIASALLMLIACSEKPPGKTTAKTAEEKASISISDNKESKNNPEENWDAKSNLYIQAINRFTIFINQGSKEWVINSQKRAAKGDYKSARTDYNEFSSTGIGMQKLKQAMMHEGDMPTVDNSAKKLVLAIETYLPIWSELVEYNKTKKYEDDNGFKGKNLLPKYLIGIRLINEALAEFDAQVDKMAEEASSKNIAKFKAKGLLLEAHTAEAFVAAQKIVDAFEKSADFKNKIAVEAANTQLIGLEKNIEEIKKEYAIRKIKDEQSLPNNHSQYVNVVDHLERFVGSYRESRKKTEKFDDAIVYFNKATDDFNNMQKYGWVGRGS